MARSRGTMRLEPMSDPRKGQRVQCARCHKMIDGDKALADLDAPAGTFYHPTCTGITEWQLWECERGNRWSEVKTWNDPAMDKGLSERSEDGSTCPFSGCKPDHTIKAVKVTTDRYEAHDWFRNGNKGE